MNTALEYSTRVVQEGGRRCKKSTLNDLVHLTPLRIPLMNPPILNLKISFLPCVICPTRSPLHTTTQTRPGILFNFSNRGFRIKLTNRSPLLGLNGLVWMYVSTERKKHKIRKNFFLLPSWKTLTKRAGSGSAQVYGYKDPDPCPNVTDPEHCGQCYK